MKLTNLGKVTPPIEIDYNDVKKCIFRLDALNHPTRRRILIAIDTLDKNATLPNLIEAISLEQKVVSKHLTILTKATIVNSKKTAKQRLVYSVNHETIEKATRFVEEINKEP